MTRLAYREAGERTAPPLILLHAIATSGAMWKLQMIDWSRSHRVIAFDLPGHGASAPEQGTPSIAAMAEAVAADCMDLRIDAAVVLGLSLGSMVAQRLAATSPSLVRAAVLANGVCVTPPAAAAAWRARRAAAEKDGMPAQVHDTLERWFTPGFRAAANERIDTIGALIASTPLEGYLYAAEAIERLDQRAEVSSIDCPALVVAGTQDAAAPSAAVRGLAQLNPRFRVVEIDAPHLSNVEQPERFAEAVTPFIMEQSR